MKVQTFPAVLAVMSWMVIAACTEQPIIISESDVRAVFTPGTTVRMLWDSTSRPVNVGATGGPNTYDFRDLDFRLYDTASMLAAAQIPQLASRYPADAITSNEEGSTVYPVFSFSNHTLLRHGRARISGTTEWYQHIVPADEWLRFPVTLNTQFTTTVASQPKSSKEFHYWTREGTVVLIDSDQSEPDTGVIKRGYVIYFSPQPANRNTRR